MRAQAQVALAMGVSPALDALGERATLRTLFWLATLLRKVPGVGAVAAGVAPPASLLVKRNSPSWSE